jgi:hypothetical protein
MKSKSLTILTGLSVLTATLILFVTYGKKSGENDATLTKPEVGESTGKSRTRKIEEPGREFLNLAPEVAYVGDAACVNCHFAEAEAFHAHPMGRSTRKVETVDLAPLDKPFLAGDFRYSIRKDDQGRPIHIEEKLDSDGKVIGSREETISIVVGSGKRGHSFIADNAGSMHQSPISWYGLTGKYELSPGYESRNLHFEFPINQACLQCHTNRAEIRNDGALEIKGLTIGCERCHGPGALHVEEQKMENGYDKTIVNPVKLSPVRRDQVCYQCHLPLNTRNARPGKSIVDYRPGTDLETFIERSNAIFSDPVSNFSASGYVKSTEESRCFQNSAGKLGCITCHNPHEWPDSPNDRRKVHLKQCISCHSDDQGCSLPAPTRLSKVPSDDCITCHMPSRSTSDIGHTALTDHSIRRSTPAYEAMKDSPKP